MKYDTIIGIDPGQSGGLAKVYETEVVAFPMAQTEHDINTNLGSLWGHGDLVSRTVFTGKVYIERVHSMPGQGVASSFKFGRNYGFLRGLLIANKIPFEEVTPRTWQKGLGIKAKDKSESKTQFKNRLKGKAQQLFPHLKITLATADAILIAEYGRRRELGII